MNRSRGFLLGKIPVAVALTSAALGVDIEVIRPQRVVDLQQVVKERYPRSDFSSVDVAQVRGRWAVLMNSGAQDAVVVKGDLNSELAWLKCGSFDAIAMDADHRLYLRHASPWESKTTRVTIAGWETGEFSIQEIPFGGARPCIAGNNVGWKAPKGKVGVFTPSSMGLRWTQADAPVLPLATDSRYEDTFVMGLPDGASLELGRSSETINIFNADGGLRSTTQPDLDAAYVALGRPFPKSKLPWGHNRVMWSATSSEGLLYVAITELSVAEGAFIAVIRPEDGSLVKIIRAVLPTSPWRRAKGNPDGIIFPGHGAAGDRLVIMDSSLDILGVY